MQETKKAFRAIDKRKDVEGAVNALSNLKGVGPAMASGNHQRPSSKRFKGRIEMTILLTFPNTFVIEFESPTSSTFDFYITKKIAATIFSSGRCFSEFFFIFLFSATFDIFCHHSIYFLQRGKFYPQLTNLVRINTPRAVQTESRKAFRKLPNIEAAVTTLCGLKGVGTTLASGVSSLHLSA